MPPSRYTCLAPPWIKRGLLGPKWEAQNDGSGPQNHGSETLESTFPLKIERGSPFQLNSLVVQLMLMHVRYSAPNSRSGYLI